MKFDQAIREYLQHLRVKGASLHTLRNYSMDLERFHGFVSELDSVDKQVVRSYLTQMIRQGAARKSMVRRLSVLRSFFAFLMKENLHDRNPMEGIERPKVPKRLPSVLTYAQIEHLFGLPDCRSYLGFRDRVLMELFYSSGLRISEVVGSNRSDFDPKQKTLRVMGKGKRQRIVPITETACQWMRQYLEHEERQSNGTRRVAELDREAIFLNRWGRRMSVRSVDRLFKNYLLKSGIIGRVTPHTIRHTIATHWLEKGMNLKLIQLLLGHKSLATTTIYTQVSPRLQREVYEKTHPMAIKKPGKR